MTVFPQKRTVRRERIENAAYCVLVVTFVAVIVICQRSVGWLQLCLMLGALLGLLGVLAAYNRRHS